MPSRLVFIGLLVIVLNGCAAAEIARLLMPSASNGISAEAQVGDREIQAGDDIKTESGDVAVSKSKFHGNAESVQVNESDHASLIIGFVMGLLAGVMGGLLLPQYKVIFEKG